MMRPPFVGHRRYSITHRAVQRLRELVPGRDDEDDETLRDTLDVALGEAEDGGRAIRTLDAMLGEPQTLIPVTTFGDLLYAIIKEDTVVTVLPQGHGEEILQRGQAMEQKVASGQVSVRPPEPREDERWDGHRRRWRKDAGGPVVIERIVRPGGGNGGNNGHGDAVEPNGSAREDLGPSEDEVRTHGSANAELQLRLRDTELELDDDPTADPTAPAEDVPESVDGTVMEALRAALEVGRRRAAVAAIREVLRRQTRDDALLPLWNALAQENLPQALTVGDLLDAVQDR